MTDPDSNTPRPQPTRPIRSPRSRAAGFTLLEVLLAAFVLTFGIGSSLLVVQRGMHAVDSARLLTLASQRMQSELEELRLKSWSQLQALQDLGDGPVTGLPEVGRGYTCVRQIRDLKADMKEITLVSHWRGSDGREHSARLVTRCARNGTYDSSFTRR